MRFFTAWSSKGGLSWEARQRSILQCGVPEMNTCPVCGYTMRYPAADYHICPCCGTEFGYDDAGRRHAELRAEWLRAGARWWSPVDPQPEGWDPYMQVSDLLSERPIWEGLLFVPGN